MCYLSDEKKRAASKFHENIRLLFSGYGQRGSVLLARSAFNHTILCPLPLSESWSRRGSWRTAIDERMKKSNKAMCSSTKLWRIVVMMFPALLLLGCAGCQTFSLAQEQWAKQQRGQPVDPAVGAAVDCAATVGCVGAGIAQIVAGVRK